MMLSLTAVFPIIFERKHSTNTSHDFATLKTRSLSNLFTTEKTRDTYLVYYETLGICLKHISVAKVSSLGTTIFSNPSL